MNLRIICVFILACFAGSLIAQVNSNNPFELYWHRMSIDYDHRAILKNKVKKVESKSIESKNNKIKKERNDFTLEFNMAGFPVKYIYYQEFGLRSDYRYNPIWRSFNDFPVYYIYEYDFFYDKNQLLIKVTESTKRTNSDCISYRKIDFYYDSLNRMNGQSESQFSYLEWQGKDTIFILSADTVLIDYKTDTVGLLINLNKKRKADTLIWEGSPYVLVPFYFGDSLVPQYKNWPQDINTGLFSASGTKLLITYYSNGLISEKEDAPDIASEQEKKSKWKFSDRRYYEFFK